MRPPGSVWVRTKVSAAAELKGNGQIEVVEVLEDLVRHDPLGDVNWREWGAVVARVGSNMHQVDGESIVFSKDLGSWAA